MQKHGIVEPAASPWASNIVLVKKKDGTLRFCVDYRRLNSVTKQDSYPLPLIDNCLNALSGSSWYSTLDLRSGYYNIPIAEKDRDKSAFITRSGCYRFTVMPFGLTCAPSEFQRLMDCVLCELSYMTCLVYLDDVIVFGSTFEKELTRLNEVFSRLQSAKLKLKPSKCSLFQHNVEFLGHVVSAEGIAMQNDKVAAIRDWPPCRNVSEVRAFMGLSGYYRRFVKDFSIIASPLYDLMKKGVKFCWSDACQEAFDTLKQRLMTGPVLALPENEGMYLLDTDASDTGLGAVLSQIQPEGERVIAYASRTLTVSERKYETTRKELLAVVYGLQKFRQYLLGRHFTILTDHAALSWLRRTPEPMPQLARWLTYIKQFDYEVLHRPGTKHGNADGLSRRPIKDNDVDRDGDCRCILKETGADDLTDFEEDDSLSRDDSDDSICGFFPTLDVINEEGDSENGDVYGQTTERVVQNIEEGEGKLETQSQTLSEAQRRDPELGDVVRMRLEGKEWPDAEQLQTATELTKRMVLRWEDLEVHNDLVYRRKKNAKTGESDCLQLLLPRSHVHNVLDECHGGTLSGHFGVQKTKDQVARRFYWNGWKADVERFCRRCPRCTSYHRGKLAKQGPLKPVLPGAPFERWYIDLTGQHPRSDRGNLWILTCIDSYTKWAEAFAIKNKEAETIAKVLVEQIFTRFGCPLSILSDQGKEVDGRIMAEVCKLFGIEKLRTTPYKPSTNQVERFHRTMNSILAKTVADHHRDWDVRLPYAMAAYRATRHDATGYSPNYLVLHREVRVPVDLMYEVPCNDPVEEYDDFVERVRERTTTAYAKVRQRLRRSAERNKRYYNIGLRPKRFIPGQWVLYFNPRKLRGKQMKWQRQYEGPYLVIATPSVLTAKIQRNAKSQPKTVHVDKLKDFFGVPPRSWLNNQVQDTLPQTPRSSASSARTELPRSDVQSQLSLGDAFDVLAECPLPIANEEERTLANGEPRSATLVTDLVTAEPVTDVSHYDNQRSEDQQSPKIPLSGFSASYVQQDIADRMGQQTEGLTSNSTLTNVSVEQPQQVPQPISMGETGEGYNLATSCSSCEDKQTSSPQVNQSGLPSTTGQRDLESVVVRPSREENVSGKRCFNESNRPTFIDEMNVDRNGKTRCNDSDKSTGTGQPRQSDMTNPLSTCEFEPNVGLGRNCLLYTSDAADE